MPEAVNGQLNAENLMTSRTLCSSLLDSQLIFTQKFELGLPYRTKRNEVYSFRLMEGSNKRCQPRPLIKIRHQLTHCCLVIFVNS